MLPFTELSLPRAGLLTVLFLGASIASAQEATKQSATESEGKVVFRENFNRDAPTGWDLTDRSAWRVALGEPGRNRVLELFRASKYEPPVRSPLNIALAQGLEVADFTLDVKVRSTTRDYGHRDLCLFFGYQDPSHFYYVHIAKEADPHANSIFLVNGQPRMSIAESRTTGTGWTDGWHKVRLVRDSASGLIQVFFDVMDRPVMTAHDRTFGKGRIGVGSFDDTGMFDEIVVRARASGAATP